VGGKGGGRPGVIAPHAGLALVCQGESAPAGPRGTAAAEDFRSLGVAGQQGPAWRSGSRGSPFVGGVGGGKYSVSGGAVSQMLQHPADHLVHRDHGGAAGGESALLTCRIRVEPSFRRALSQWTVLAWPVYQSTVPSDSKAANSE
jgi:hypothetical protein